MAFSSAQFVAISRLVLASVFLLAIYIDPSQPVAVPGYGYALLASYVLVALVLLGISISDWWLDYRFAGPVHVLDLVTFGAVVFFTEGYTSPFFTFSVFLLLSASIRWSWRATIATGAAVTALYLFAGLASEVAKPDELDVQRLIIRGTYLMVLSALFAIYALNNARGRNREEAVAQRVVRSDLAGVAERAAECVRTRTRARTILFAWRDEEEPRSWLEFEGPDGPRRNMFEAEGIAPFLSIEKDVAHLFDTRRRALLNSRDRARSSRMTHDLAAPLAEHGMTDGLALAFRAGGLECAIYAADLPLLSTDTLAIGEALVSEIVLMAEQASQTRLAQDAAEAQVRLLIARDLHDSVAQVLAGISFRIEGLKRSSPATPELCAQLADLQDDMAGEQVHLRELIGELRQASVQAGLTNIVTHFPRMIGEMGRQWGISCIYEGPAELMAPGRFEHELRHMIREGVANAVRHGEARTVTVGLRRLDGGIELRIADDGKGLPGGRKGESVVTPRSLAERAALLGGDIAVGNEEGALVIITVPMEGQA